MYITQVHPVIFSFQNDGILTATIYVYIGLGLGYIPK